MRQDGLFDEFMKDTLTLRKPDGRSYEGIKACVTGKGIAIPDVSLPLETGDCLSRTLPNGSVEEYVVDDAGFQSARMEIPAQFVAKCRKRGVPPNLGSNQFVVSGPNARINIHSQDFSTNSASDPATLFAELRKIVETAVTEADRAAIQNALEEMEAARGTPSFRNHYIQFMSIAADHLTLLTPFLPALAQLLR